MLDFANHVLFETEASVSLKDNMEQWLDFVDQTYQDIRRSQKFLGTIFVGIGIAVPKGQKFRPPDAGALFCSDALQELVSQRIGLPCYIQTPANLCALSVYQDQREVKNILYLYGSVWLGAGAICEGAPLRGQHSRALEIFHLPLGDRHMNCPICGECGCIGNDLLPPGMDILQNPELIEEERLHFIQDRGHKLGELIAVLVNLFDPGIFYIGGYIADQYELIAPYALSVLHRRVPRTVDSSFQIKIDTGSYTTIQRGINQIIYEDWYPLK